MVLTAFRLCRQLTLFKLLGKVLGMVLTAFRLCRQLTRHSSDMGSDSWVS